MNKEMQKFAEEFWDDIPRLKKEISREDHIFERFDKCFKANRFDIVDSILFVGIPYVNFNTHIKIAVLSATLPAKAKLQHRAAYYEMCKNHFQSREETKDRAEALLAGLE